MMDFEDAAQRLARDQKKMRGRQKQVSVSEKAKRQAEYQRKQQEKLRVERERVKLQQQYQQSYMKNCDRALCVKALIATASENGSGNGNANSLQLKPTSIYGEGDKISLPPSVLEILTSESIGTNNAGNPWTFRIGILNPEYQFPASPLVRDLQPPAIVGDDEMDVDSDDDDDGNDTKEAYMDELSHKYIAYTHCTVVEFTQEEGHVGIPQSIASALLEQANRNSSSHKLSISRTVDPAASSIQAAAAATEEKNEIGTADAAAADTSKAEDFTSTDQTPGHLAWGAFDIPDALLEISLVKLPKGRGCTLVPTREAVQNNFYGLKDVKLVLEQSLIRSRATLSVGDVVTTWHRGVKFDLNVTKVLPAAYSSITCINTDIEVDIGELMTEGEGGNHTQQTNATSNAIDAPGGGYTLGTGQSIPETVGDTPLTTPTKTTPQSHPYNLSELLPEPPVDMKEGVCTVQIRYSGGNGKRRFEVSHACVKDLFDFTSSLIGKDPNTFRLVTRFPRRVFSNETATSTMVQAGIQQGQELFMVEFI